MADLQWHPVLLPYVELLLFLAGTVLYSFLLRELLRRPDLPAGKSLLRLAAALLLWFGGTLLDHWLVFLVGPLAGPSTLGALLDVARSLGWLLAMPLLLQALERLTRAEIGPSRLRWMLVPLAYSSLGLFVGPMLGVLDSRSPFLADSIVDFYPRLVAHALICLLPSAGLAWQLSKHVGADARMARFLRSLARLLLVLVGLVALGLTTQDVWEADASPLGAAIRLLILGALLLPGLLFAFFVQRYNLLRLSMSNRSMRQLMAILLVVLLAMLAGPALGANAATLRPLIAWGVLLALAWGGFALLALPILVERSAAWRVFFGRAAAAPQLEDIFERLEKLDGDDEELMSETAAAISDWLGCDAEFVPRTLATEALWRAMVRATADDDSAGSGSAPGPGPAHRLAALPPKLARELDRHDLRAVFPLTVRGETVGLLGLASSVTGGGHDIEELEAVGLVLRQLASTLLFRRLAKERLMEQQRVSEQERLGLLGLVSASLAHEIKNPLSSIKVLAQALREETAEQDPDGEAVLDLDAIVEQIDRLDGVAREILSFARPRAGETTELATLLRSAVYVLAAEAKKKSVVLESELGAGRPHEVLGSPATWQTIAFNLLRNAVDHAPRGGTVQIRLGERSGRVLLEVSNPGKLDETVRGRLFEPFVGSAPAAVGDSADDGSSDVQSFGLGLSLVAERVEQLGGKIEAREVDGRVIFRVEAALSGTESDALEVKELGVDGSEPPA